MFPTKVALDDSLILHQMEERYKEIQYCYGTGNRPKLTRALPRETTLSRVMILWQRVRVRPSLRRQRVEVLAAHPHVGHYVRGSAEDQGIA